MSTPEESLALYPDARNAPESLAPYLALPENLPRIISETAEAAAQNANDRFSVGVELQRWFRDSEFVYDESAPYLPGSDPDDPYAVMTALLEERHGFCVHYASTFAVMARHLGVPTRISVGYAVQATRDEGVVLGGDLHAWPEIFIDGMGWIPFEPTPGGAGMRADERVDAALSESAAEEAKSLAETTLDVGEETLEQPLPGDTDESAIGEGDTSADPAAPDDHRLSATLTSGALIILLLFLLLSSPAMVRRWRSLRRSAATQRGPRPAEQAWDEFIDTVTDLQLLRATAHTPARGATASRQPQPPHSHQGLPSETQGPRAKTPEALVAYLREQGTLRGDAGTNAAHLAAAVVHERYSAPHSAATDRASGGGGNGRGGRGGRGETTLIPSEHTPTLNSPQDRQALADHLESARAALAVGAGRRSRLRATLLPASVLRR